LRRLLLSLPLVLAACSDSTVVPPVGSDAGTDSAIADAASDAPVSSCGLVVPDAYDGVSFTSNAAVELDVRARFNAWQAPMRAADSSLAVKPTATEIAALYDAGNPSLRSLSSAYYAGKMDGWFTAFEAAAGNTWTPAEPPTGPGGQYGGVPTGGTTAATWLFSARGTDLRQATEKGSFASMHFAQAYALMTGTVTPATVDRILAWYGAHPDFPHSDKGGDGGVTNPDVWTAQYAKRRDDKSNPTAGYYRTIKASFIREKTLMATVVFYLHDAIKKASVSSPTPGDLGAALHGYGELTAFVHGFRMLPQASRKVTDAQIDQLLSDLGAPVTGDVTSYTLVTDTATMLGKLQAAIQTVGTIEGFTAQELDAFKVSY
jgi:hypothetical protein